MTGLLLMTWLGVQELPRSIFRAEVRQVYLDVFVEKNGAPVEGLTIQDFEVLDEGTVQREVRLLDLKDHPLSAVLLLDTSVSVRGAELDDLERAARTFKDGLTPYDEIGVMQFATHYRLREPLVRAGLARSPTHAPIDFVTGGGATALHDSLEAATALAETGSGRPLVVLFSDGDENSSWLTFDDLLEMARHSFTVIYAVRKTRVAAGSGIRERRRLEDIAAAGGGRLIALAPDQNVTQAFAAVLREMRSRYLLVFEPGEDARVGWHDLEVRVPHDANASVRTRSGYVLR